MTNNRIQQTSNKPFENSVLMYILLTISFTNILGYGSIVLLLWGAYGCMRLLFYNRIHFDKNMPILIVLMFSVLIPACLYIDAFSFGETVKSLNYILTFFVAYNGVMLASDKERFIKRIVFSVFAGFVIYLLLILIYNLQRGTFESSKLNSAYFLAENAERTIFDFWTKSEIAATLVGLLSAVAIGYACYALFCEKNILLKLLAISSLLMVFYINFATATRTPILLFLLIIVFLAIIFLFNSSRKQAATLIVSLFIVLLVLFVFYQNDVFGLKTYMSSVPIFERFKDEGIQTSRWEISKLHFDNMFEYLWGGNKIYAEVHSMAHNYLQEAHDLYGIFATVSLLALTVMFLINIVRFLFLKEKVALDFLFLSMYISILAQCCAEPVFEGFPLLFWCLILFHGLATAYLKTRHDVYQKDDTDENC